MTVELIHYTPNPETAIAEAAKICYYDADKVHEKMAEEQVHKIIRMLTSSGHGSALEHASFTFLIKGISRACSHELVRHRIGSSYNQRSQRYINEKDFNVIVPDKIKAKPEALSKFYEAINIITDVYASLLDMGIPKEDARYVLPNATETELTVTMNARALLHFFELRCCTRAQWEIRELANTMLKLVKEVTPVLFEKAGAFCDQNGFCREEKSCGRVKNLQTK